ncbi:MAG TPA: alanine--tRNA ligase [Candidatus Paceibacterota bacterium]
MTHSDIRQKFLKFFEKRGHKIVPSSSLLPTDPSVLFTTAGMQQFKPYYTGEADPIKDFGSLNTVTIQKCIRTSDIDEVGDESHLTFFEMLGNFSFGGASTKLSTSYWKKEAIEYAHEFITQEIKLEISYVTVFEGSSAVPKDEESKKIWQSLGITDVREEGMEDVFWGPTGNSGPCGPTTEIYCKNGNGKDVEIWNIVFNEFFCDGSRDKLLKGEAKLKPSEQKGIDTGMGLERLTMIVQEKKNIFETDLFEPTTSNLPTSLSERQKRIVSDHLRASVFLIADGIQPSNKDQGYVLRRLMRRVLAFGIFDIQPIIDVYGDHYSDLTTKKDEIILTLREEYERFKKTLDKARKELGTIREVDAKEAFRLYESFGMPFEVIKDTEPEKTKKLTREDFDEEFKKHQSKSREGSEKKFGGHGLILDTGELKAGNEEELVKVTRLHTATHLLHASLRMVLGDDVHQAGSDITAERLRFDFTFPRKVTPEEIKQVEELVNEAIKKNYEVNKKEMPYEEAIKTGALAFFKLKYPNSVKVYTIGPEPAEGQPFSKELCGGPHVNHTGEIGTFKIAKEEAVSAGTRRIRATVEL